MLELKELKGKCHMCGKCCEAIHIMQTPEQIKELAKSEESRGKTELNSDPIFIRDNWNPITREEAFEINPKLKDNADYTKRNWSSEAVEHYNNLNYYTCSKFDHETRKCTVHDRRPHVCSGYPWYGRRPESTHLFYSDDCGYRIDLEGAEENGDTLDTQKKA